MDSFRNWQTLSPRRWLSAGVLVAMLFMQFATAAYACPVMPTPAMPDCHAMAAQHDDGSTLCKAHCVKDGQSTAATAAPDLQANPASLTLLLGVIEPAEPAVAVSRAPEPWQLKHSGAPPIYLSLLVLRN
jgi:hypothetical protein